MHATAIFQRTESGRNEIKNKMHGLTQSERLALIVIDGVTSYGELRRKLNGLSEERFERALSKLLHKSLIFEVLLPTDDDIAEEFDTKTVDRFLQQDPLDPVTIMSVDPEEEFDLDMQGEVGTTPQYQSVSSEAFTNIPKNEVQQVTSTAEIKTEKQIAPLAAKKPLKIASVDFYVPLENADKNVLDQANHSQNKMSREHGKDVAAPEFDTLMTPVTFSKTGDRKIPWDALLVIGGLILIIVSIVLSFKH